MSIALTFINRSAATVPTDVLIFQRNVAPSFQAIDVAWKVIRNCGVDRYHPFVFSTDLTVAISDSYGNFSPALPAVPGRVLALAKWGLNGRRLGPAGASTNATEVEVRNDLDSGAIDVNIFNSGRLLARKTSVAPQQMAVFQYHPAIWIGTVSQVVEGDALESAVIDSVTTEFSLLGIRSANLVMTGGGAGPTAAPYAFAMQNIVRS